jgi:hypothetical protein
MTSFLKLVSSAIVIIFFSQSYIEPIHYTRNESRAGMKNGFEVYGNSYNDQVHDVTGPDQFGGTAVYISNVKPNATNHLGVREWTFPTEGTIEMWVKSDDWFSGAGTSDGNQHRIILANSLIFWSYLDAASVFTFDLNGAGTERISIANFNFASNEWIHLAYCWNSAVTQAMFTNGVLAGSRVPGALGNIGATNNLAYGHYIETVARSWRGWIDNVKIYETCILDWDEVINRKEERQYLNDLVN